MKALFDAGANCGVVVNDKTGETALNAACDGDQGHIQASERSGFLA
jgi:hypothetical protein